MVIRLKARVFMASVSNDSIRRVVHEHAGLNVAIPTENQSTAVMIGHVTVLPAGRSDLVCMYSPPRTNWLFVTVSAT